MATTTTTRRQAADPGGGTDQEPAPRKRGRLLILMVLAAVVVAVAGYLFLRPSGGADSQRPAPPEPGVVLTLDPINVNLADGHYLKVGIALQLTVKAPKEIDGAKALDIAIDRLSGQQMSELITADARDAAKEGLLTTIEKAYPEEVMDLYFTEFVMQ